MAAAGALVFAGCGDDDDESGGGGGGGGRRRRGRQGRRPAAGLEVVGALGDGRPAVPQRRSTTPASRPTIQNAEGDKATQQQQAEQAITNGATVLLLVNLDSGLGRGDRGQREVAGRQGDRLRPPDARHGDTDYYVSFDNEAVGKLQGEGLVDCLDDRPARIRRSRCSTARRPTTTRRCSRTATTRSSTRSSTPATGPRSPTSRCPTGTTRRR